MTAFAALNLSPICMTSIGTTSTETTDTLVFDPCGYPTPGVARYEARAGGIPIGFPTYTQSLRRPTKAAPAYKVVGRLTVPTMEVTAPSTATGIQPAPTPAYSLLANIEVALSERCTSAERIAFLSYLLSLFVATISASDGNPSITVGSPLREAILNFGMPY